MSRLRHENRSDEERMQGVVLKVRNLTTTFPSDGGPVEAVSHVSFDLHAGETLAVVGESGCGKSSLLLSILGLLPSDGKWSISGEAHFEGTELLSLDQRRRSRVLGRDIGMIFQDPRSTLNPVMRIGDQLCEAVTAHFGNLSRDEVRERMIDAMNLAQCPDPLRMCYQFPHQLSGGMRQRVTIAMAIVNQPTILFADEPTTALDVTTQAQVLATLAAVQSQTGLAMVFVTHDLALVAELVDRVIMMYAGRMAEVGSVSAVFSSPLHPYTRALLASIPRPDRDLGDFRPIRGKPPLLSELPSGCAFHPRCPK